MACTVPLSFSATEQISPRMRGKLKRATSLISALSSVRALGSLTLATRTTRGPAGPLRDTWNWKVGVASSHHWVFQSQALAISTS